MSVKELLERLRFSARTGGSLIEISECEARLLVAGVELAQDGANVLCGECYRRDCATCIVTKYQAAREGVECG